MNLGHSIGVAIRDAVRPEPKPWELIGHQIGKWVYEWVRVTNEHFDPIRYEAWQTQADERTCPICGQLSGQVWEQGEGFTPPVHDNCRCERVFHHVEFSRRETTHWEQRRRWTVETDWRWEQRS